MSSYQELSKKMELAGKKQYDLNDVYIELLIIATTISKDELMSLINSFSAISPNNDETKGREIGRAHV